MIRLAAVKPIAIFVLVGAKIGLAKAGDFGRHLAGASYTSAGS
jgi:hypothetical protein